MTFEEIVHYRRSVRYYKPLSIDPEKVKHCLELATLAPNSSNMQLWEFYHITDPELLRQLSVACLSQSAAKTAQQMVVFVTRQDLFRKRASAMLELSLQSTLQYSPQERIASRIKNRKRYYGYLMPFLYARFFGLLGWFRIMVANLLGLFRPIVYQVSEADMRVVVHKTCALAAQTFMLAMASEGYDTCPMEGFDGRKARRMLQLPFGAEINMIISCGIRDEKGIWGERVRVPFEEVYKRL
ncbi:MAG TPA: nitroreductase family protein [Saprospirales bacterium]|nr:nitroreductase family protein [Saprospirales bacterium]